MSAGAAQLPPVYLSHVYVVVDAETYEAMRKSPQLAAVASEEVRHTQAGTRTWTGFYLYGQQTYLEFFNERDSPDGAPLGDSGLGLAIEHLGDVTRIATALKQGFGERIGVDEARFTMSTGEIPWFTGVGFEDDDHEILHSWVAEMHSGYLATLHPGARIDNPLSRKQYEWWRYRATRPMRDVVSVTVALRPPETSRLSAFLRLIGWTVEVKGDRLMASGPEFELTAVPAKNRAGIQQIRFSLARNTLEQAIALGHAQLSLKGKSGRLQLW